MLRKVSLNENQIKSMEKFTGHPKLRILEMKVNQLEKCDNIANMPMLTELHLSGN